MRDDGFGDGGVIGFREDPAAKAASPIAEMVGACS